MPRLQFFQGLFDSWNVVWEDTRSKKVGADFERKLFHLSTGRYDAKNAEDQGRFLEFLGSRIVFLIDWNRARKGSGVSSRTRTVSACSVGVPNRRSAMSRSSISAGRN